MIIECPYCLSEIREGARKCFACGEWINGSNPDSLVVNGNKSNVSNKDKTKNKQPNINPAYIWWIIAGIFIPLISVSIFFIWKFWDKIIASMPEKVTYNYKCNLSSEVGKEFNKNIDIICERDNPIIRIQYKDKDILVLDGEKLLEKCGKDQICDKENAININESSWTGWFIIENYSRTKAPSLYVLSFVNKPAEAEKIQSLKSIFENHTLDFGDSVYINILWTPKEPLVLEYKMPWLSVEIFNKTKNHEKTIILWLSSLKKNDKVNEFNYKEIFTFFNKSQFEAQLASYLSWLEVKNRESIAFFDYINDEFSELRNEKFDRKYFSFYINAYPTFPTIGYWRELNERSCNSWKDMTIKYNRAVDYRYNRCWNSWEKWCIRWTKINWDYSYTYLSKIVDLYPSPPIWNIISFIDIPGYDIESIEDESCKWEIKDALWKIKSNLVTSSNP